VKNGSNARLIVSISIPTPAGVGSDEVAKWLTDERGTLDTEQPRSRAVRLDNRAVARQLDISERGELEQLLITRSGLVEGGYGPS
jgi:hypothetical protein